jgi:septal ring factor EnvC (AmiA/AmiB activator)
MIDPRTRSDDEVFELKRRLAEYELREQIDKRIAPMARIVEELQDTIHRLKGRIERIEDRTSRPDRRDEYRRPRFTPKEKEKERERPTGSEGLIPD